MPHFLINTLLKHPFLDQFLEQCHIQPLTKNLQYFLQCLHHLRIEAQINVIEIDRDSVAYLNNDFKNEHVNLDTSNTKFKIIEGDFLKQDIPTFFNKKQVAIIGNYPYNISSQIIFKAIENREYIPELSGMFQKEVAKRIAEKEGSKVYGIISVLTQALNII